MRPRVVLIGAGGHARVVADAILVQGALELVGFLDRDPEEWGKQLLQWPILGGDEYLVHHPAERIDQFIVALGGHHSTSLRTALYAGFLGQNLSPATVLHPNASVSRFATVANGTVVLAGAAINAGAKVGHNVIVNTGAIVEHDSVVGDHVQLSTGAILTGGVTVEESAFVGARAVVLPFCRVGKGAIVGAGAVVTKDVPPNTTVLGVPARPV